MENNELKLRAATLLRVLFVIALVTVISGYPRPVVHAADSTDPPVPLLSKGHSVDWWFVFKFNSSAFPGCGDDAARSCPFGGDVRNYAAFGQQYVFASSETPSLQKGSNCAGDTTADPIGATFDEIYNNSFYYVIWNDQFYDDPLIHG